MKNLGDRLRGVTRVFLDTSIVVYFVEDHSQFAGRLASLFESIDAGAITGVASAVTLAEALVSPIARRNTAARDAYIELMLTGHGMEFRPMDSLVAVRAAEIRAGALADGRKFTLTDAVQAATAIAAGCELLITNDQDFAFLKDLVDVVIVKDFDG